MSSKIVDPSHDDIVAGGFPQGAGKRGAHIRTGAHQASALASYVPPRRGAEPKTARSRIAAAKTKRKRPEVFGPTPERLAKGDVIRTTGGAYLAEGNLEKLRRTFARSPDALKAQAVLDRLRSRSALSDDPGMSEQMFQAGKRYEELVHLAGLGGIGAQNLLAARGSGDAAHMMPTSESSARARDRIRKAWDILPDEAATAMHGLLVEGHDAESVGRAASMYNSKSECRAAGITLLRIALSMLVAARWA